MKLSFGSAGTGRSGADDVVRVEIDCAVLARLMAGKPLAAADLHCLDPRSKQLLWRLCLDSCLSGVGRAGRKRG